MQISLPWSAVPLKGRKMKIWVRFLSAAILLLWDFPVFFLSGSLFLPAGHHSYSIKIEKLPNLLLNTMLLFGKCSIKEPFRKIRGHIQRPSNSISIRISALNGALAVCVWAVLADHCKWVWQAPCHHLTVAKTLAQIWHNSSWQTWSRPVSVSSCFWTLELITIGCLSNMDLYCEMTGNMSTFGHFQTPLPMLFCSQNIHTLWVEHD